MDSLGDFFNLKMTQLFVICMIKAQCQLSRGIGRKYFYFLPKIFFYRLHQNLFQLVSPRSKEASNDIIAEGWQPCSKVPVIFLPRNCSKNI